MEPAAADFLRERFVSPITIRQVNEQFPGLTLAELQEQIAYAEQRPKLCDPIGFTVWHLACGERLEPQKSLELSEAFS